MGVGMHPEAPAGQGVTPGVDGARVGVAAGRGVGVGGTGVGGAGGCAGGGGLGGTGTGCGLGVAVGTAVFGLTVGVAVGGYNVAVAVFMTVAVSVTVAAAACLRSEEPRVLPVMSAMMSAMDTIPSAAATPLTASHLPSGNRICSSFCNRSFSPDRV